MVKKTLDKDLGRIETLETQASQAGKGLKPLALAVLFLMIVWAVAASVTTSGEHSTLIIIAAIIGGYMALNIGANDVANNVGPAVGSRALTMFGAIVIAAIFEAAGAILAGGDVVNTIQKGIINPAGMPTSEVFVWAMLSALFAAALWVNVATWVGAPVSTTHAVVGGVMGAGIAAAGFSVVSWGTMGAIAASWVISPVLGGGIAAIFLAFIKYNVIYKEDKVAAARRWVPLLVAIMAGVFSAYLVMKGLGKIWKPGPLMILTLSLLFFIGTFAIVRPIIHRASQGMENRNKSVRALFTIPLICSAALLSFAHGANDVANAVGPLAAIVGVSTSGAIDAKVGIPLWVMLIGAAGLSAGLFLFGPKLIRTVGEQITKMNPMRAYCVALSAGITVLIASALGLPVSSTHIAVGAIFGVGFFREWDTERRARLLRESLREQKIHPDSNLPICDQAETSNNKRKKLVRRSQLMTIVAAWIITVPCAALMAAVIFWIIQYFGA
ncbi:MAG: anion permease [Sneathiella sp.]|jgi:PiT family inorganic phosphate transporter|uniref:inorganic phosphate transporter n=1 Tax=Sneathiella sp. TaxID=1964365 RepID=UPI000C4165DB|nr:inorganic phosphate transporter [Sneathiella sp.]MAL80484.1 anion permease [Sneathiella sp.]